MIISNGYLKGSGFPPGSESEKEVAASATQHKPRSKSGGGGSKVVANPKLKSQAKVSSANSGKSSYSDADSTYM